MMKKIIILLIVVCTILFAFHLMSPAAKVASGKVVNNRTQITSAAVDNASSTTKIKEATLIAELVPICSCESTGTRKGPPRQFNQDGTVVRGKANKLDIGMCQINLRWNGAQAKKMGLDLFTKEGNIKFANYLYKTQGTTPWNWSRKCWAIKK